MVLINVVLLLFLAFRKICLQCVNEAQKNLLLPNAPGQGHKRASTAAKNRNLLRLCKKDRIRSSETLSSELTLSNSKHLSARTVYCRLLTLGYKSYPAKKKPLRTPACKKQRLLFVREHQYWCHEWNNIVWTGEAHFEVFNKKNCMFARSRRSENNQPFNFVPKAQGGDGCVNVRRLYCR